MSENFAWRCQRWYCKQVLTSYTQEALDLKISAHLRAHGASLFKWQQSDYLIFQGMKISLDVDKRTPEQLAARYRPSSYVPELPERVDPREPGPAQAGF